MILSKTVADLRALRELIKVAKNLDLTVDTNDSTAKFVATLVKINYPDCSSHLELLRRVTRRELEFVSYTFTFIVEYFDREEIESLPNVHAVHYVTKNNAEIVLVSATLATWRDVVIEFPSKFTNQIHRDLEQDGLGQIFFGYKVVKKDDYYVLEAT